MQSDAQIRAARLHAVFDRLTITVAITVVSGAAATVVLAAGGVGPAVWIWLGLVAALAALRLAALAAFRRDAALARIGLWEAVAVGGALASGLLWGLGAALLPPADPATSAALVGQLVLVLLLAAMAGGVATVHAVHLPAALAFIVPAGVPLALRLALAGDGAQLAMAAAVLLYVAALCVAARRAARQFDATFALQHALSERTRELDAANARLRAEIEDHRATGESLRQSQRMEAIGQLTGGIAHDFNNMLAVIGGNLQLIGRRAEGQGDIQRLVAAADRAVERGVRLTASLLSFTREQKLRPEEVDLNELVQEFAPLLRRTLGGRMDLVLEPSPGPLMALVDPAHFQAALMHMVINARDASTPGRRLGIATLRAPAGAGGAAHPGPFACVRVSDTGPGLAAEAGSGPGLSQVVGFARQSGGVARVEEVAGGGSAVAILLPALAGPAPQVAPLLAGGDAGRVLLVEDDADVREVLQESLSASSWQVTQAADGAAAREVLEGDAPLDIVVSDVVMPGAVSGVDLARLARTLRPGLPVLLISGYPTATLAAQGVDEAELNLLRKPFTHAELLARMAQLRQGASVRPDPSPPVQVQAGG
jgi:signal transduction histidine kinase/CheY-like chemotaxis protein